MVKEAAGTFFLARSTKRLLLNFRSNITAKPNCFGFWGGKLDNGEDAIHGLSREISEELGPLPPIDTISIIDVYLSPDSQFRYYSFVIITPDEFIPITNDESQGYCWCSIGYYPKPLHPGARAILESSMIKRSLLKLVETKKT